MKKTLFLGLLAAIGAQIASAQTTNIIGTVKDEKGNPLHYVYITDEPVKAATFTDSLGNFKINVSGGAKLKFQRSAFKGTEAIAAPDMQVSLTGDGSADVDNATLATKGSAEKTDNSTMGTGGVIAPGHVKGNVHGNRYLLDNFAHGFLINASGELIHTPGTIYDYDKMGGYVLSTSDMNKVAELSFDQIASFTLFSGRDEKYVFEKAPSIDPAHYVQVLSSGKKYKIYKIIKTTLTKADYVNSGMVQHGNDYDEYVDDTDYYVWDVQGNKAQKIALKKKAIKEGFAAEADKVNKYLSDTKGSIDDAYLSKMGDYMNQ
jgi:hypothetical protein